VGNRTGYLQLFTFAQANLHEGGSINHHYSNQIPKNVSVVYGEYLRKTWRMLRYRKIKTLAMS